MLPTGHPAEAIPDPRARSDRRRRDGLGLLPRATNRWERQRRQEINRQIGVFLLALGLSIWLESLIVLVRERDAACLLGAALGLYIALRGFEMVMWRDRRRRDRRRTDRPQGLMVEPESTGPATLPQLHRRRSRPVTEVPVSPPEVD